MRQTPRFDLAPKVPGKQSNLVFIEYKGNWNRTEALIHKTKNPPPMSWYHQRSPVQVLAGQSGFSGVRATKAISHR